MYIDLNHKLETLDEARGFDTSAKAFRKLGFCDVCAAQAAFGDRSCFAGVQQACTRCSPLAVNNVQWRIDQVQGTLLVEHMRVNYSDWAIANDRDCVKMCADSHGTELVNAYGALRSRSRGFRPRDPKANNDNRIDPAAIAALLNKAPPMRRTKSCEKCGIEFNQKRSTARFCSSKCRVADFRRM